MRKSIIALTQAKRPNAETEWLPLAQVTQVEITSEEPDQPIEAALLPNLGAGWRAADPGPQLVRLHFDVPQQVHRIRLCFVEPARARTQEFVLRYAMNGEATHEIVRQQWTFSPHGSTCEVEEYRVELAQMTMLELAIVPDISGGDARATLAQLRLA
jgi:hypothetical protein